MGRGVSCRRQVKPCRPTGEDGQLRREMLVIVPAIAASVAGTVFFQGLFLAFPPACRQWALLFVVSGILLALVLVAIVVLLVPGPGRRRGYIGTEEADDCG